MEYSIESVTLATAAFFVWTINCNLTLTLTSPREDTEAAVPAEEPFTRGTKVAYSVLTSCLRGLTDAYGDLWSAYGDLPSAYGDSRDAYGDLRSAYSGLRSAYR